MVTANRIRLTGLLPRSPRLARASLLVAAFALGSPPAPDAPLPRQPALVAKTLTQTVGDLRAAIVRWAPKSAAAPPDVVLYALYEQRLYRLLARETKLAGATLPRLPRPLRATVRDLLTAHRELYRLTPPLPARAKIKVGSAEPAATLLAYYREAQRRFGVTWDVLASVNFVESKFGKLRNASASGAQGPMQFMPPTWAQYGLGGNVHDAHDAILGAANYLHASGAPRNIRHALHAYNPSPSYVDAVLRYARVMRVDRQMFYELYSWQVFLKTPHGERRVTGPGRPPGGG
jgi:soluble lytic murein transglycosylase-like protein